MTIVVLDSLHNLAKRLRFLRDGDVIAYGPWRCFIAADPLVESYWIEGKGRVEKIPVGRRAAGRLRKLIETTHQPGGNP